MHTRPFVLRSPKLDLPSPSAGRLAGERFETGSETPSGEEQDSLATSKLERLAAELRALGIDF